MYIQIIVDDILYPTLETISSKESLSPQQYASNIVASFLERQYRASVTDKLNKATIEEIDAIKEVIDKPKEIK